MNFEKAKPVLEIPIELGHPEHSPSEHGEKSNSLNEGAEVDQEEHEDGGEDEENRGRCANKMETFFFIRHLYFI